MMLVGFSILNIVSCKANKSFFKKRFASVITVKVFARRVYFVNLT